MNTQLPLVSRQTILTLANYDLGYYKVLRLRDQIPFTVLFDDQPGRRGHTPWLAVVLVVGDLVAKHSGLTRDEFAQLSDINLPAILACYQKSIAGESVFLAVARTTAEVMILSGTRDEIIDRADNLDDEIQALTFINVQQSFREIQQRADRAGVKMLRDYQD